MGQASYNVAPGCCYGCYDAVVVIAVVPLFMLVDAQSCLMTQIAKASGELKYTCSLLIMLVVHVKSSASVIRCLHSTQDIY